MSEKTVIFYAIEAEFLNISIKLIEKMYEVGERCLFLCDNPEEILFYDSKLWTYSKLSFIPHGNKNSISIDDAKFCHTWLDLNIVFYNDPVCLLHNGLNISDYSELSKFNKIIDIFKRDLVDSAKKRSKLYKHNSFINQKLWIQNGNSWVAGKL